MVDRIQRSRYSNKELFQAIIAETIEGELNVKILLESSKQLLLMNFSESAQNKARSL